jgi:RNA polymerase sigma factor (sigma-70 family)
VSAQQASFVEFYAEARDDCLRAVYASVGNRQAAEDCVAEAFARAWASWRKVSAHPVPRAWVMKTALNLSVSSWRRRRREVPLDDAGERDRWPLGSGGTDPAADAAGADSAIMTFLGGLPLRQRQVIALRVFLGFDTAATAQALGIAPGTVTAHLTRATSALREQLTGAYPQEEQP